MLLTVLLSALFAGLVAIAATIAIEQFGGRVGGVLASIPTTIVPASVGFWWQSTDGGADFSAELMAVPLGMLVNVLFLLSWRIFPPLLKGRAVLAKQLLLSLAVWVVAASISWVLLDASKEHALWLSLAAMTAGILLGLVACWSGLPSPKGSKKVSPIMLFLRGLLAAVAIGVAVLLSSMGTDFIAGLASVFPAIFMTTMVSLWLAQGRAVQIGSVGPMMLGSSSVSAYALFATWSFVEFGPLFGALIAWILSVLLCSLPAGLWLYHQQSVENDA